MRRGALRRALGVLVVVLMAASAAVTAQQGDNFRTSVALEPPQQAPGGRALVRVSFAVAPEHYVWRDRLRIEPAQGAPAWVRLGEPVLPVPKRKHDPYLNETIDYYDGEFTVAVPLDVGAEAEPGDYDLPLLVRYTGCGPKLCSFRRDQLTARLSIRAGAPSAPAAAAAVQAGPAPADISSVAEPAASEPGAAAGGAGAFSGRGVVGAVLLAFVAGLGLALTPCVYPLIPITISLVGATSGRGRLDGLVRSLVYVFGISVTYSVAGVVAAATGAQFGAWLQHPAVYVALAVLFVLLAAAMFDVYSFDLSSQRVQRLQVRLQGRAGLLGIWVVGILSGAAATACIAPIVVGALLYVGQRGSLALGGLIFFALAWGMGAPLVVLGTFTGLARALPKSGRWMNAVKGAFGLALLGAALYFLHKSRLVPQFWFGMLLGASLLVAGVFVGAFDTLSAADGAWPRLRKAVGLLFVIGAAGVFIQPVLERMPRGGAAEPAAIRWLESEGAALAAAEAQGKPVLLDFWAEWCAPCRRMFVTTYADPRVVAEAERFVMARIDTEALSEEEQVRIGRRYGVRGVPTAVLLGTDGSARSEAGYIGADRMLSLMRATH